MLSQIQPGKMGRENAELGQQAVPKFIKQMNGYLAAQGKKAKDYYIHYAYCPKCAKKYGDNYMILFAKIS